MFQCIRSHNFVAWFDILNASLNVLFQIKIAYAFCKFDNFELMIDKSVLNNDSLSIAFLLCFLKLFFWNKIISSCPL